VGWVGHLEWMFVATEAASCLLLPQALTSDPPGPTKGPPTPYNDRPPLTARVDQHHVAHPYHLGPPGPTPGDVGVRDPREHVIVLDGLAVRGLLDAMGGGGVPVGVTT